MVPPRKPPAPPQQLGSVRLSWAAAPVSAGVCRAWAPAASCFGGAPRDRMSHGQPSCETLLFQRIV